MNVKDGQTLAPAKGSQESAAPYVAPAILWEEEFVALAHMSVVTPNCPIGSSPSCTP